MIQCRICGNTENNRIYPVYERRKNKGDIFKYLHCGKCGTLQLEYEELDIQKWYEDDYYSFHISVSPESKIKDSFRKGLCWMLPKMTFTKSIRKKLWRRLPWIMYFEKLDINFNSKILDIGCGNGAAVYRLSRSGFKNVLGIDAFCKKTPFPIKYYQCDIFDKRLGKYDFIMLHHSFEHMSNPDDVLGRISDLLLGGGYCIMRIPVCGGYAWNKYSTNWWQIDPPLHYYLYSVEAIRLLCDRNKLFLEKVIYDSEPRQILVSEALNDTELSFDECIKKAKNSKESKKYWDLTDKLNEQYKGDQAVFYIRKKTT